MDTFTSTSPEDTHAWACDWGRVIEPGTLILLTGDLGAGKTQFVKGLARGLDLDVRVHSPTFAIVNAYEGGRLPLAHLDLYRLETPHDLMAAGVEEFLTPEGISVVEWGEKLFAPGPDGAPPLIHESAIPAHVRRVLIEVVDENTRLISHDDPRA